MLSAHAIEAVADVRRFAASRRHPHFAREQLAPFLETRSIAYHWLTDLGGRRSARKDSRNTGWRVAAFRGYADYMETPAFRTALESLTTLARDTRVAIMCAEALWWQCHRRLIADSLVAMGHEVVHIESPQKASPHRLIPPARLVNGELDYTSEQPTLELDDPRI